MCCEISFTVSDACAYIFSWNKDFPTEGIEFNWFRVDVGKWEASFPKC